MTLIPHTWRTEMGQHIHLVKFDVTSSDGAGNGFNYEDGTFSPQEVQETIRAINNSASNGFVNDPNKPLKPKLPPAEIFDCAANPGDPRCQACKDNWTPTYRPQCPSWLGAQTTIQRWYLDPLLDDSGVDRTLRTVFTHDHFGPSTHQQAGLYAGLLVEPIGSSWRNSETGAPMGRPTSQPPVRPDGGPTSWKADILTKDLYGADLSYREFALEFQDFQLAYISKKLPNKAAPLYPNPSFPPNPDPSKGYINHAYAIGAPSTPTLISTGTVGTQTVNYINEPVPFRVGTGDLSEAFNSAILQPGSLVGMEGDPATPQLRAYQGDNVQIRVLVGAHMFAHQFNLYGPTWFAEPSWKNSGYRSAQAMGLSEHFELLFQVPASSASKPVAVGTPVRKCPDKMSDGNCADYLYSPSMDVYGIANGLWGLFRAYDSNKPAKLLQPLPNNPIAPGPNLEYTTCPSYLAPGAIKRTFNITVVTAQKALALRTPIPGSTKGQIVFNDRNTDPKKVLSAPLGIMYVRTTDLDPQGRLMDGVPIEPLILRANAGDCIEVNLTNALDPYSDIFKTPLAYQSPLTSMVPKVLPSKSVGLHPQLLSYDAMTSTGINIGYNSKDQASQVAKYNETKTYQWFAGKIERTASGALTHTPVEFGSLNLFPSDPLFQHFNGLFGAMVIEPAGSTWTCGEKGSPADCEASGSSSPTSRASANVKSQDGSSSFREFVAMISDDIKISPSLDKDNKPINPLNSSAVNYRTEPRTYRYANFATKDFSCMTSNALLNIGDPQTPIFTADPGDAVRFRMMHPFGLGTSQVFTVHGHVWQRNPYANNSREIGSNSLSQWQGSRDNHGSSDHFDLLIEKAGGEAQVTGDHLYTVYLPSQAQLGAWGLFRVGKPTTANPTGACTTPFPPATTPYDVPPQQDREILIRQPTNLDQGTKKP